MSTLQYLEIENCRNLDFQTNETGQNYTSLQYLRIRDSCYSLTSFPLDCFPALKNLTISECPNLKSISILDDVSAKCPSSLETSVLRSCLNLVSFPRGGLLTPNLSELAISSCVKLGSLPEQIGTLTALQSIELWNLESLASFPHGGLPLCLRSLEIKIPPMVIGDCGFQLLSCLS
ncbi:hypothetical protein L6164_013223 [Bauhinia variegata]|nr:hypothetical protein L6164_013223 [Bauhinia variegata]